MSSIFRRVANIARANLGPLAGEALHEIGRQARRRTGGSTGRSTRPGTGRGGFPDLGGLLGGNRPGGVAGDQGPVWGGPAKVRTVEVGGRPVTSATHPFAMGQGLPTLRYAPQADGEPDPGEVVWTWIPYDDDPSSGKDRPALIVARTREGLLAAQMTSKDRAVTEITTDEYGRVWMNVGRGKWDNQGRESELRLDRLWVVQSQDVRREGAALDRGRFEEVAQRLRMLHG